MDNDTFSNDNVSIPASLLFTYDIQLSTTDNEVETISNHSIKQKSYEVNFLENETLSNNSTFEEFKTYDIQSSTTENEIETIRNHSVKQESYEVNFLENETISNNSTFEEFTTLPTASGKS